MDERKEKELGHQFTFYPPEIHSRDSSQVLPGWRGSRVLKSLRTSVATGRASLVGQVEGEESE